MAKQDNEISGLDNLRKGSLFYIIAAILEIIGFALIVTSALTLTLSGIVAGISIIIVAEILIILWFLSTRKGFKTLSNLGKDVRSGVTATTLILIGILIIIVGLLVFLGFITASLATINTLNTNTSNINPSNINGGILGLISASIGAIVILIAGGIISFVGNIMVGLAYRGTGDIYNNNNLRTGGLLIVIGIILYIIPYLDIIGAILVFIGYILVYSGLGSVITMLSKTFPQPYMQQSTSSTQLPPQPSAPLSQIGTGKLSSNGIAEITIYSQGAVQILSAAILGTNNISSDIFPAQLNSGYNNVKINFKVSLSLIPGNLYTIQLLLSNGQTLNTVVTYQP
ncbi:MAG: DUF973 family protein [Saccharolobus sp.]